MKAVDSFGVHTARSAQALKEAGVVAAFRYHYNATRAEVDILHAAGIGFALIAEFDGATWHPPLHAPELGGQHGRTAVAVALSLGLPAGSTIWFTADTFIGADNYASAATYWDGAASPVRASGFLCGAYGGSRLIDWLHDHGHADRTWQCGAAAWNQFTSSTTACVEQLAAHPAYGGVTVDLNDVRDLAACGVWMPPGVAPPAPTVPTVPPPTPPPEDDDMPKTVMVADGRNGQVFQIEFPDGILKNYVENPAQMAAIAKTGVVYFGVGDPDLIDAREIYPPNAPAPTFTLTPEQIAQMGTLTHDELLSLAHLSATETVALLATKLQP